MPRTFVAASSHKVELASAITASLPFSVFAWTRPTNTGTQKSIFCIGSGVASNLLLGFNTSDNAIAQSVNAASTAVTATSGNTFTSGSWTSVLGIFAATNSRTVQMNQGSPVTNSTSNIPAGLATTTVGGRAVAVPDRFFEGDIGWVFLWNVALDAAEGTALARGINPCLIRPASLLLVLPLMGNDSPEPDYRGGTSWTVTGATKATSSPPLLNPFLQGVRSISQDKTGDIGLNKGGKMAAKRRWWWQWGADE